MREYKFRVWWEQNESMIHSYELDKDDDYQGKREYMPWYFPIGFSGWEDDDFEIMQFTGRTDPNGKDIYDGDIVAPQGGYEAGECEHPGVVEWDNDDLQWVVKCYACRDIVTLADFDLGQVIGNKYENKELLHE